MYLFFNPHLDTGIKIPHIDKVGHFIAFSGLSFLFDFAFTLAKIWGIGAALVYGILVELIQSTLPNRQASLADVVADMSGCLVYYFVFKPYAEKLVSKFWKPANAK
ncbi:VanZ family protein [Psychrosphaera algicola]|uniref:VanZ family protein n=2 Tax=Psychrosphaera TaxID=907197 RepID=A0ABT5FI54_9GAMM|nr:VanZ family protein [Psychrosphaera sp. G1-22]MDC2890875.1 VanZ family protein [Psychrosphaera sp. G1-22]